MRKKNNIILSVILLVAFLFAQTEVKGQRKTYSSSSSSEFMQGLSVVPKIGVNAFYGDLVDKSRASYSLGVTGDREMTQFLTLRGSIMGGQMRGQQINPSYNKPYATFTNFYMDFMGGGTYKPLDHLLGYFRERTFEPYALAQLGLVYYNATERWGEVAKFVTPGAGNEGEVWRKASEVAPILSMGGGVNIWINSYMKFNAEFHGNLVFSDRLDAHDVWYGSFPDGEMHETAPYDFYYIMTAGMIFTIQDSKFRNVPKYNRASYLKARKGYKPPKKKVTKRRPTNHRRGAKKFFFF